MISGLNSVVDKGKLYHGQFSATTNKITLGLELNYLDPFLSDWDTYVSFKATKFN